MWSFFGSGHGKGHHDGGLAIIKHFIQREQLNAHGKKLQYAINFLHVNLYDCLDSSYTRKKNPYIECFGMFCLNILIAILTYMLVM
jgi:uncharacterized membrane protein